jgi:hypothetical protein
MLALLRICWCLQRSGKLPRISNTPWRGDSGLWDSVLLPNGRNYSLIGGWYDDGELHFGVAAYKTKSETQPLSTSDCMGS